MPIIENLKIALETAREKYRTIVGIDDAIDAKAGTLLGFEIAVGIGYLSLVLGRLTDTTKLTEGLIGLVCLLASTIILLKVSWPRTYFFPVAREFFEQRTYLQQTEQQVLEGLISDTLRAIESNRQTPQRKVKWYRFALALLIIASALLILSNMPRIYA